MDKDTKKALVVNYTNWLVNQNLLFSEDGNGIFLRSSTIGGNRFTAEQLFERFIIDETKGESKS